MYIYMQVFAHTYARARTHTHIHTHTKKKNPIFTRIFRVQGTWMFLKAVLRSDPSLVVMQDSFGMTPVKCLRGGCLAGRHLGSADGKAECCTCR